MRLKYQVLKLLFRKKSLRKIHSILLRSNSYYQNLSAKNQKVFCIRTKLFIKTTDFINSSNLGINYQMITLISSAFVQLTFGLRIDVLKIFNEIVITPKPYSYKHTEKTFLGDVNLYTKRISLTWPVVKKGFRIEDDGVNLALHEFSHCLIIENSKQSYYSKILNEKDLVNWKKIATQLLKEGKLKNNSFFRNYANTNLMELFAVSAEEFFERPDLFYTNEPELFNSFCLLLNQDIREKLNPKISKSTRYKYNVG